ncbi:DNA-binding domain-containing protein [Pseudomarimonas arenosa]|uniref:DNA-binding domain-containing protein n=1 Tax=Pseudomarimonas arenosa TaxID=2774145 RepID=A0AAW3ZNP0_9GAMM|nr:putative DNA-binding domain-containing protein [Pseudomarimonas arenosa]MBD8526540.1 putative DNA-binding domain-containing protein [Pseudomarimonas arenosa]
MRPLEAPARLRDQQVAFAAHLRSPDDNPAPDGIEDRRMAIYRDLFYNSLEGILASNFPVLRGLRGDAPWHALVRDFYREHYCHTPLFPELGREFLRYLETRGQRDGDPPFLLELAHYEWVELALSLEDPDDPPIVPGLSLLEGTPVLSSLAWPLAYRFPVHQIRPDHQPGEAPGEATFLLVVRDRQDEVRFKQIDVLAFQLLQTVASNETGLSGGQLLNTMATNAAAADPEAFVQAGHQLLQQLQQRDVILGALTANPNA